MLGEGIITRGCRDYGKINNFYKKKTVFNIFSFRLKLKPKLCCGRTSPAEHSEHIGEGVAVKELIMRCRARSFRKIIMI